MTPTSRVALRTAGLTNYFRRFEAVSAVDLEVREGGVHALVGPNGAGKTTLFNLLTGFIKPSSGTVTVFDEDVTGLRPEQIARKGVARSFHLSGTPSMVLGYIHVGRHVWCSAVSARELLAVGPACPFLRPD